MRLTLPPPVDRHKVSSKSHSSFYEGQSLYRFIL
jgi:hypothetical protein